MIRALIFDCFGVLYWDDISRLYSLADPARFSELNDLVHAFDHGFLEKKDFIRQVAMIAGTSEEKVTSAVRNKYSRNEPLITRVSELRSAYKTALLSNMGSDTLQDVFAAEEQASLFDAVVISSEVGLIKPSRDIFEFALERLGVPADEVIFIDDRPANIDGADRVGMHTILFSGNDQFEKQLQATLESASNA